MKNRETRNAQDIGLDDIIKAARELRDAENALLPATDFDQLAASALTSRQQAPSAQTGTRPARSSARWWAAAACLLGFLAGFATKGFLPSPSASGSSPIGEHLPGHDAQALTAKADTIFLREVVHDTIFQTRIVLRDAPPKAVVAQTAHREEADEAPAAAGCSMLCDDIPYAYLAHN